MLILSSLAFTACSHDDNDGIGGESTGGIAPSVELNTSVKSSEVSTPVRAGAEITVNDLALTIKSKDGSFSKTWPSVSDYDAEQQFKIGQYTVEASYGSVEDEGFEKPAYYGSTEVTVTENNTTPVSLTATLANTMVSIDYTDNFKWYMKAYNAQIHSVGGDYITFVQGETRPAYVRPGNVSLTVSFTRPMDEHPTSLSVASFDALARHHYHITLDLDKGAGEPVLKVTLDEMLDQEPLEIELSDDLINSPAPTITPVGVNNGDVINHIQGVAAANPIKANITARGGLKAVTLTTQSKSLVNNLGWPVEINLLNVDDATKARMQQLGLKGVGLWKNPEKMAIVDFTDVLSNIGLAENNSTSFAILVTDNIGKTSEVFSFSVNLEAQDIKLSNPTSLYIGQGELSFDMTYNGGNPDDVIVEYLSSRGVWTQTNTSRSVRSRAMETYRMKVTVPTDNNDLQLRARTKYKTSDILTVKRLIPEYGASSSDADVWAKKAFVNLSSAQVSASALASVATVHISTDGTTFKAATITSREGNTIGITGLNPGTKYIVRVSLTGTATQSCTPYEITTEAASNVPNAGFETLTQTLNESKLLQGGQWSISAGINYDNYATYTISEPTSWTSVNAKTNSGAERNTWYVQPSTFNSSLTYSSTVPPIKVFGTGGGTETPAAYKGFTPKSGANAMVLRNVGWNPVGKRPDVWLKEFAGKDEYYNHSVPDNALTAAGKLFLGSYRYQNNTESYNEGLSFASRPEGLSFYYIYTPDAHDAAETGLAKVEVLNGSNVIATGTAKLSANTGYTLATVRLSYIANAPKATSIRVMFASSSYTSESSIKLSTYNSRYESYFHGATLVVDELSLTY